jgi:hypothetical protein
VQRLIPFPHMASLVGRSDEPHGRGPLISVFRNEQGDGCATYRPGGDNEDIAGDVASVEIDELTARLGRPRRLGSRY